MCPPLLSSLLKPHLTISNTLTLTLTLTNPSLSLSLSLSLYSLQYSFFCLLLLVLFFVWNLMEPQNQQQQALNKDGGSGKGGHLCRPSITRWTPTTDQIRILKDLYYNNGVRSPSAEQIQRISARLRKYGKIEGKNVFYWFQNHKARERQKKRLNSDVPMQRGVGVGNTKWNSTHEESIHTKYPLPNITSGEQTTHLYIILHIFIFIFHSIVWKVYFCCGCTFLTSHLWLIFCDVGVCGLQGSLLHLHHLGWYLLGIWGIMDMDRWLWRKALG